VLNFIAIDLQLYKIFKITRDLFLAHIVYYIEVEVDLTPYDSSVDVE